MRISDCSSDVCSSDLRVMKVKREILGERPVPIDVVEKPAVARTEQYHMVGYFGEGAANPQMEDEEARRPALARKGFRSEEHTSELQSLMRISYAVFRLKKKKHTTTRK